MSQEKLFVHTINKIVAIIAMHYKDTVVHVRNAIYIALFIQNLHQAFLTIFYTLPKLDNEDVQNAFSQAVDWIIQKHIVSLLKFEKISTEQSISFKLKDNSLFQLQLRRFSFIKWPNYFFFFGIKAILNLRKLVKLFLFQVFLKLILKDITRYIGLELCNNFLLSLGSLSLYVEPACDCLSSILSAKCHFMIRDIGHFEDDQQIFGNFILPYSFSCCIIIEHKFPTGMILQIVRKCETPVLNHIIMTKQIIAVEVIRSENVVAALREVCQLSELRRQSSFEEIQRGFRVELVGLEEVEEITVFFEELKLTVGFTQLTVIGLGEKVRNCEVQKWLIESLCHFNLSQLQSIQISLMQILRGKKTMRQGLAFSNSKVFIFAVSVKRGC